MGAAFGKLQHLFFLFFFFNTQFKACLAENQEEMDTDIIHIHLVQDDSQIY